MNFYGLLTVLLFVCCARGEDADIHSYLDLWQNHNYLVSLIDGNTKKHFCSGTLIAPKSILTAASCIVKQNHVDPFNIKVHFAPPIDNIISIHEIAINPNYNPNDDANDIALLQLKYLPRWLRPFPENPQTCDIGSNPFVFAIERGSRNQIIARSLMIVNSTFSTFYANYTDERIPLQKEYGGPIFNAQDQVVGLVPFISEDDPGERGDVLCYPRLEAYKLWIRNTIKGFSWIGPWKTEDVPDGILDLFRPIRS